MTKHVPSTCIEDVLAVPKEAVEGKSAKGKEGSLCFCRRYILTVDGVTSDEAVEESRYFGFSCVRNSALVEPLTCLEANLFKQSRHLEK